MFRKALAMPIADLPLLAPSDTSFCLKSPVECWSVFQEKSQNFEVDDRKVTIAPTLGMEMSNLPICLTGIHHKTSKTAQVDEIGFPGGEISIPTVFVRFCDFL